jgi:hypothetical protein
MEIDQRKLQDMDGIQPTKLQILQLGVQVEKEMLLLKKVILVMLKEKSMKVYGYSQLKILMYSHFQEEELLKLKMLKDTNQASNGLIKMQRNLWLNKNITIRNIIRSITKILETMVLMRKSMDLHLPIRVSFHNHGEE